jgi:ABC-2 type transport system permease protein
MRQFSAFFAKELRESAATYRLYIVLGVFAFFGVLGPFMALLAPMILESAMMADMGIAITVPEPTAYDAWAQFFGNLGQMGVLVLAIVFSGAMGSELSRGTLIMFLTKGMKRSTIILSKFAWAAVLWSAAFVLCLGISYTYTQFYFDSISIAQPVLVFGAAWLFGLFIIALAIFGGTLTGSVLGAVGVTLGVFFTLALVNIAPAVNRFNPQTLAAGTLGLITGASEVGDFVPALIICAVCIVGLIGGAVLTFNNKKV